MDKLKPEKLYYRIGEVSEIVGVDSYVIRYWETQFKNFIRPDRTKSNHRLYTKKDIEHLIKIKTLLYNQKFTINGAKKRLIKDENTPIWERRSKLLIDMVKANKDNLLSISSDLNKLKDTFDKFTFVKEEEAINVDSSLKEV